MSPDEHWRDQVLPLRERIDTIDRQIVGLLRSRAELAARIQAVRLSAGGSRTDATREPTVLGRYQSLDPLLGRQVGESIIALCKAGGTTAAERSS